MTPLAERFAFARPIVCVITRARGGEGSAERRTLLDRLAAAAQAGASMIQVRERQLADRALLAFVRQIADAIAGSDTALTVNDRVDIALAGGASGVHLKSNGPPVPAVRRIAPSDFLIGRSVHVLDEARRVEAASGCDYLLFGTIFPSRSKREGHPVAGVDALARLSESVSLPVLAIGGITVERARDVAATGAAGAAAISLFAEAPDIAEAVHSLRTALTVLPRSV